MQQNRLKQLHQLTQKYNSKLQPLFSIGRKGLLDSKNIIDYVKKFGFCEQDIPSLLQLAGDMEIYDFDYQNLKKDAEERLEFFGVIHAWYALSQLKAPEAKEFFISLLERIDDEYGDDWVFGGFRHLIKPYVLEIYPYFIEFIMIEEHNTWIKIEYLEVLKDMVQTQQLKSEEIEKVIKFILTNSQDPILNSFAISGCVDLNLNHCHDLIAQCFKKRLVDIDHMGDLEDVEIKMGLRETRESKRELTEMQKLFQSGAQNYKHDVKQIAMPIINNEQKIGRNDPCPCASGKKYKKCCSNK